MGKVIKKKLNGMSWWMKTSLVLLLTLTTVVFMYEGWYKPNQAAAAPRTYYITDNTGTAVATGVTTNVTGGTTPVNPTSAAPTPDINLLGTSPSATTSNRTTGTYTAGATMLESIYNTPYASATTVTGTSYFGRLRDGTGGYTVGFQLFYVAANGTRTNFTGAQATQVIGSAVTADFTVSLAGQSATVPAGSMLGIRVIYVSGASTDARVYFGSTANSAGTGNGGVVIVDEAVAAGDTLTVGATAPIATSPQYNNATGLVMQRIPVSVNANTATVNSITLSNSGAAAAVSTTAKVFISTINQITGTLPAGAIQIGSATLTGTTSLPVTLTNGGTAGSNDVTALTTKYIYVVYDLAGGATGALSSDIDGLGVVAGDTVAFGTPAPRVSNVLTLSAPPAGDTLTVGANAPIALSPQGNNAAGLVMQRIPVTVNANTATINSITLSNNGTAAAIGTTAKVYISTVNQTTGTLPAATLIGSGALSGTTNTPIALTNGGTAGSNDVTALTTKYIYVVYDLAGGTTGSLVSEIDALGVVAPDTVSFGTPAPRVSNTITLNVPVVSGSAINNCAGCHGYKAPIGTFVDGTSRNDAGKFQGSHNTHVMDQAMLCSACHVAPASELPADFGHSKGSITMAATISGGTYSVASPITVTNTPVFGKCNTTTCHANVYATTAGASPNWGAGGAGCGICHTTPIAASGPATGSHVAHAGSACISCHNAGTTATAAPTTGHGDGDIDVTSGYLANVVKHTTASGYNSRTCSAASCHAPYSASGSTPVWGQTAGCEACHLGVGAFINYSTPTVPNIAIPQQNGPNTGSHSAHMNYGRYVCQECHDGAVTATSGGLAHTSNLVNVTGGQGGGYNAGVAKHAANTGYLTCTTACHTTTVPTWGQLTLKCIDCHNAAITRTKGRPGTQLSSVKAEFGLAWGHKRGAASTLGTRTAVTDGDCIVCHLEGQYASQKTSKYHADGNIDLRDPDVQGETPITNLAGSAFTFQRFSTSYAAATRYSDGHLSAGAAGTRNNADIAYVISIKFCLKCHDANGAANTTARTKTPLGTAMNSFEGIAQPAAYTVLAGAAQATGIVNVFRQFSSGNSSVHPVRAPRLKSAPLTARLQAPYNNIAASPVRNNTTFVQANSVVMNCFDCHNTPTPLTKRTVSAHGNAATIRGTIYVSAPTLCNACHLQYTSGLGTSSNHGTGSAFPSGGNNGNVMSTTCHTCHASANAPARPIRAQDYHGFNNLQATGANWTGTYTNRPFAFIRNTANLGGHRPRSASDLAAGTAGCTGGCPGGRTYSPGGAY